MWRCLIYCEHFLVCSSLALCVMFDTEYKVYFVIYMFIFKSTCVLYVLCVSIMCSFNHSVSFSSI